MSYGMKLWRPSKRGANMTAVLVWAAKLISGIYRDASHTAFFKYRSVNQDVMLAGLDVLSADNHCRMAHARLYARHAAAATAAALYARNDPCSPEFDAELSAANAPDYMGAAAWNVLHTRDGWYSFARTCHDTALSHRIFPEAALTHTDPFVVGVPSVPHVKKSGAGSVRRLLYAGACVSLRMDCVLGLVRQRSIDGPGGWLTSVTPHPETTSGTLALDRFIPIHPRRSCT